MPSWSVINSLKNPLPATGIARKGECANKKESIFTQKSETERAASDAFSPKFDTAAMRDLLRTLASTQSCTVSNSERGRLLEEDREGRDLVSEGHSNESDHRSYFIRRIDINNKKASGTLQGVRLWSFETSQRIVYALVRYLTRELLLLFKEKTEKTTQTR